VAFSSLSTALSVPQRVTPCRPPVAPPDVSELRSDSRTTVRRRRFRRTANHTKEVPRRLPASRAATAVGCA